ncbi:hypothetical protein ACP5PY_12935 [Photobacterium leiognathi subsp. mandapamensis]
MMSFSVGAGLVYIIHHNIVNKIIESKRKSIQLPYENIISNLEHKLETEKSRNVDLEKKATKLEEQNSDSDTNNNVLLSKLEFLEEENRKYKLKHEQVAFEVSVIQKYYKDSRISMSID